MTTIVWAGKAIPDADTPAQKNFGVVVEGNRIIESGQKNDLVTRYPRAEVKGGENLLLTASMVNAHDHGRVLGTAPLGISDDLLEIWLPKARAQLKIDPYTAAAYSGLCLLKSGVSSVIHLHTTRDWKNVIGETSEAIKGYQDVGIRVVFCVQYADNSQLTYRDAPGFFANLPPSLRKQVEPYFSPPPYSPDEYVSIVSELIDNFHDDQSHTVHIAACAAGADWSSDHLITTLVEFSQQNNIQMQMHLLETKLQTYSARHLWGTSSVQHLAKIGALGPWLTLAHMVWAEEEDLPLLAEKGVGIAHNPSSNLRLRSGIAPIEKMIAAGVSVGVGLDGFSLDNDQDYLRELRLAWVLGNKPGPSAIPVSQADAWRMGTSGGVEVSFGEQTRLGRLAPGYLADLTLIDFEAAQGVWFFPEASPLDVLLQHGTRHHVKHVMVNGQWVVKDGKALRLDEDEVVSTIQQQLSSQKNDLAQRTLMDSLNKLTPHIKKYYQGWERDHITGR
jgi:5-methylthioadenosine/S-adenosylhomocysteine deaminase